MLIWQRIDADCRQDDAFVTEALRNLLEGLGRCAGNKRGFRESAIHERIMFREGDEKVAKGFAKSPGEAHSFAQVPRRGFASADRTQDEGNSQAAHERGLTERNEGDVVDEIERSTAMKFLRQAIPANLTEEVIDVQASWPALPLPAPCRQIEVHRLNAERALRDRRFEGRPVIFACEDGNVVSLIDKREHPVPADSRLRTFMRLACVGRQENFHDRESWKGAILTSNNFTIHSDVELMNPEQV